MPPPLRAGGMAAERARRLPRGGPEFISTSGPKFIVTATFNRSFAKGVLVSALNVREQALQR